MTVSAEGPGNQVEIGPCPICENPALASFADEHRQAGHGYRRTWRMAKLMLGSQVGKHQFQRHFSQCSDRSGSAVYGVGDAQDAAEALVDIEDYFTAHGITLPPDGWKVRAATVTEKDGNGNPNWVRIAPETPDEDERIEIRQAEPVIVQGPAPSPTVFMRGQWETWITTPDLQCGYWMDFDGNWHSTHDERAVDLTHQIARAVADSEGLAGWLDVGDYLDVAAFSTHKNGPGDMSVHALNKATQRGSDIAGIRRHILGPEGKLVILDGNHPIRMANQANNLMPWIVGLKRADDPEDEYPVLSVPFLCRFRDHGVRWINGYPGGYYRVNSNLVGMHAPVYGSQALATARKLSAVIKMSVVHGHTHRREALAVNDETDKGMRTYEIWSDGALCRVDGSVPSAKSSYNDKQDRIIASMLPDDEGLLSENWHAGLSVVHVDQSEKGLFSREAITIWGDWCMYRGVEFQATVDVEGNQLNGEQVTLPV